MVRWSHLPQSSENWSNHTFQPLAAVGGYWFDHRPCTSKLKKPSRAKQRNSRGHYMASFGGDQTRQMYGNFEGFPLFLVHEVWVGRKKGDPWIHQILAGGILGQSDVEPTKALNWRCHSLWSKYPPKTFFRKWRFDLEARPYKTISLPVMNHLYLKQIHNWLYMAHLEYPTGYYHGLP